MGEPFIDTDGIADAAVAVLTADVHVGEVDELTGPRALPFAEATATGGWKPADSPKNPAGSR